MHFHRMNRREVITLLGGAAAGWPVAGWAQQRERMQRVGVLIPQAAEDPESQARITTFAQGMQEVGWVVGRNVQVEYRWGAGDADRVRQFATELAALAPDVIVTNGASTVPPLLRATRTVPIVFMNVADPVGSGFVESLSRPGDNATGFMQFEYSLSGKWLEVLKQLVPSVKRAAILRDPAQVAGIGQFAVMQAVAPSLGIEAIPINARDAPEIERAVAAFARGSNGGLIVTSGPLSVFHRGLIIKLAAEHKLPAVYFRRLFTTGGGLISYGPDLTDQFRQAAGYVDRILRGEKPSDLPVQAPTKYELVINLKTAKALGLTVPDSLLARADEVIE